MSSKFRLGGVIITGNCKVNIFLKLLKKHMLKEKKIFLNKNMYDSQLVKIILNLKNIFYM